MNDIKDTALLLVDVQGNLAQAMFKKDELFKNLQILIQGLNILEIPIVWAEQMPDKLGPTLSEISEHLSGNQPISKSSFSCLKSKPLKIAIENTHRKNWLIAGIESHICVYQSTFDFLQAGYRVEVIADGVSSRTLENKTIGLNRCQAAGAGITSTESILFELLKDASAPAFRQIAKLVK